MAYDIKLHEKAVKLRKNGLSFQEISNKLNIAKSTLSLWLRSIKLNNKAFARLEMRKLVTQHKTIQTWKLKRLSLINNYNTQAMKTLKKVKQSRELYKLLCAFLFWTEGGKSSDSYLFFINSDSVMVKTFITLLRQAFTLDENKLRALVHIHEYHDEDKVLNYWSKLTGIKRKQFSKSYLKPHTKKRIRENYLGSIRIRYYDYRIALELRSIYNIFANNLGL